MVPKGRMHKSTVIHQTSPSHYPVKKEKKGMKKRRRVPNLLPASAPTNNAPQCDERTVTVAGEFGTYEVSHAQWPMVPSLPTSELLFFPFEVQHSLLSHLQEVLEKVCERFGNQWCPQLMIDRKWTHFKAIELNCWPQAIMEHSESLPAEAWAVVRGKSTKKVLHAVADIRHLAVHRRPQDVMSLSKWLDVAEDFTSLHKDTVGFQHVSNIAATVRNLTANLLARQQALRNNLRERLEEIAQQQARLAKSACDEMQDHLEISLRESGDEVAACLTSGLQSVATSTEPVPCFDEFPEDTDIDDILLLAEQRIDTQIDS